MQPPQWMGIYLTTVLMIQSSNDVRLTWPSARTKTLQGHKIPTKFDVDWRSSLTSRNTFMLLTNHVKSEVTLYFFRLIIHVIHLRHAVYFWATFRIRKLDDCCFSGCQQDRNTAIKVAIMSKTVESNRKVITSTYGASPGSIYQSSSNNFQGIDYSSLYHVNVLSCGSIQGV